MQVYGFLEKAQMENVTADLAQTLLGLFFYNTTDNKMKIYDGAVRAMVTEDGVATLTNKIFSGGTITGATISGGNLSGIDINLGVATDANKLVVSKEIRANLEALTREEGSVYFSTDEQKYLGDDGLNLVELGGGGAGGINYTLNPDFETNADDHVAYKDSASEVPDDGTGGAPTLAIARSIVAPLDGKASGIISKPASNTQGEGVKVANEDFAEADKGVINIMKFSYDASDANYNDGDFRVYFKDETNSKIIRVNGEDIKAGKGTHYARVQVPIDCDNGSLIIHCAATHALAVEFKYDRVSFGPQIINSGSIIDDWKSYPITVTASVNPTFGTNVKDAFYRRVGDSMEIKFTIGQTTTGTNGTGDYYFSIPSGYNVDTSKLTAQEGFGLGLIGSASVYDNSYGELNGSALWTSSGIVLTVGDNASSNRVSSTYRGTGNDAIMRYTASVSIPILGWSSQSQTSEDFGGRDVIVLARGADGENIASTLAEDIPFKTTRKDTTNSWSNTGNTGNNTNDQFTAPETGDYMVTASVFSSTVITTNIAAFVNGSIVEYVGRMNSEQIARVSGVIEMQKGDTLSLRTSTGFAIGTDADLHHISIHKLASSQQILETEIVAARYTSDSGQTILNNDIIKYEDKGTDSHNAYNVSTGIYTVPVSGYYVITFAARNSVAGAISMVSQVDAVSLGEAFNAAADNSTTNGTDGIYLEKGQEIRFLQNTGFSITLTANGAANRFSIWRVK